MKHYNRDSIRVDHVLQKMLYDTGISMTDIQQQTGLSTTVLNGHIGANSEQYFSIWQVLPKLSGNPAIGIELIKSLQAHTLAPALFSAFIAQNYREAIYRVSRFKRLTAPEKIHITNNGQQCIIELEWLHAEQVMPAALVDATFAFLVELGRSNTGCQIPVCAIEVSRDFGSAEYLSDYFDCAITYASPKNRLTLVNATLDLPFKSYNKAISDILIPKLESELSIVESAEQCSWQVRQVIERLLGGGNPKIASVAKELAVSVRTLQRRITDEGHTYKDILNQVRCQSAKNYLLNTRMSLYEVSALLGYDDQNSFYRAFKQWTGQSPSSWREKKQSTG